MLALVSLSLHVLTVSATRSLGLGSSVTKPVPLYLPLVHDLDVQDPYKVDIDLFVMSKCPDARRCEDRIGEVLDIVHSITRVTTNYIANQRGPDVQCRHGPSECKGNIQQLCAYQYSPGDQNYATFWPFVECQNDDFSDIGEESLAEECLEKAEFADKDIASIKACMTGYEGEGLLRASAGKTEGLGVAKSCTIYINSKYRCTHDGGEWYDCEDGSEVGNFVDSICDAYEEKTSKRPVLCDDTSVSRR